MSATALNVGMVIRILGKSAILRLKTDLSKIFRWSVSAFARQVGSIDTFEIGIVTLTLPAHIVQFLPVDIVNDFPAEHFGIEKVALPAVKIILPELPPRVADELLRKALQSLFFTRQHLWIIFLPGKA